MNAVTESGMAMPSGIAVEADERAQAHARVRARAMVAERARAAASSVAADWRASWIGRETPPSLRQVVADAKAPVDVPGDHDTLRRALVVWRWLVAVPAAAIAYSVAAVVIFVHMHPARAVPAYLTVAALAAIWLS